MRRERALREGDCTSHAKSEPREGTAVIGAAAAATIVSLAVSLVYIDMAFSIETAMFDAQVSGRTFGAVSARL